MAFALPAVITTFVQQTTKAAARQSLDVYLVQTSAQTITMSGAFTLGITLTGNTSLTFPTSGTLVTTASLISDLAATTSAALAGKISDETGTGSLVFANTPTLVTPVLGVATATSINKVAITAPATSATLTLADGSTLVTSGAFSATFTFTAGTTVTFPTTGTLYGTAAGSITSAQLRSSLTDETGSGSAVFATSPTLVTPVLGAATGTSLVLSGALTSPNIGTAASTAFVGGTIVLSGAASIACGDIAASAMTLTSTLTVSGAISGLGVSSTAGVTSSSATAGIGYTTGAGGTVTQLTNRTTGVTLNKITGQITTNNASLAAEASADFVVTNSACALADVPVLAIQSGSNSGGTIVSVIGVAAGSFTIRVHNGNAAAGTAETGAIVINYVILKGASA